LASDEPLWFDPEDAIEINKVLVSLSGEEHLLRDEGLLISTVHRPRNLYLYEGESDVVALASSLLFAIARNHPFVQGNKRTAFAAALIFLENNGYGWAGPASKSPNS
jgi:death-on-curing protein